MTASPTRGRIASNIPGRLRVKLHGHERDVVAERTVAHLQDHPGVAAASAHPSIGSVTIHYDSDRTTVDELLGVLHDLGIPIARHSDPAELLPEDAGHSRAAVRVSEALDTIDRRLSAATGRRVDLKFVFPATFVVFGIRNTLVNGLGLTTIPGFFMLWYAFDAFYKMHKEAPAKPSGADKAEPESVPAGERRAVAPR